jgi:hypothetical protein
MSISDVCENYTIHPAVLLERHIQLNPRFQNLLNVTEAGLIIPTEARPLTHLIAHEFDT